MSNCKLLTVDEKKCTNCHVCIMACPVDYCIINKQKSVTIDDSLCIGCGKCYKVCPHNAISIVDDTKNFLASVNNGEKNILIVSPVIFSIFRGNYQKFITWLRESFIPSGVFNEALGAEIYSILCTNFLLKEKKKGLIYQHCPSIVEYIKIFYPNLIEYLAPFQSPALITAKIIREEFNYEGNIAYIGPCISKKIEFNDPDTSSLIQFNITLENLIKYLKDNNINIESYEKSDFDLISSLRLIKFCKTGGFKEILEKRVKNLYIKVLDGNILFDQYLKEYSNSVSINSLQIPDFLEVYSCSGGCFRGPCSKNILSQDEEEILLNEVKEYSNSKNNQKLDKFFNSFLKGKEKKFERSYLSENAKPLETLSNTNLKQIYSQLLKFEPADFLNCRSCGYESCQKFASSIFHKRNERTNCRYYVEKRYYNFISDNRNSYFQIQGLDASIKLKFEEINKSLAKIINFLASSEEKLKAIEKANNNLLINADKFEPIILAISEVSEQINLLSLNASIEASRTGEAGKGFSVVSSEIRKLADKTKIETAKISPLLQSIMNDLKNINQYLKELTDERVDFSESINTLVKYVESSSSELEKIFNLIKQISFEI